jgi:hypothetical protein
VTNASGSITITAASSSAILTNTGNWAGTWQLKNPSDFLNSSTVYVSSVNGLTGAVTITFPATTTINGTQAPTFFIVGDNIGTTSTVSGATTTIKIINTGNWSGTWNGLPTSTFYLASNPNGYISSLNGALLSANNLSDLGSTSSARTNIGYSGGLKITISATGTIGLATTSISQWNNDSGYLTSLAGALLIANNLSDLTNTSTARSNIGYSGGLKITISATGTIGLTTSSISQWNNDSGFLTSLNGTLLSANNLSDLNNSSTARTNIGFSAGNKISISSTGTVGLSSNNISQWNNDAGYGSSTAGSATTTINASGTTLNGPAFTLGSSTTILPYASGTTLYWNLINTGNWAGTWQGTNSSTYYFATNPSNYISSSTGDTLYYPLGSNPAGYGSSTASGVTTSSPVTSGTLPMFSGLSAITNSFLSQLGNVFTFGGTQSSTITGDGSNSSIERLNDTYFIPSNFDKVGCAGSSTATTMAGCLAAVAAQQSLVASGTTVWFTRNVTSSWASPVNLNTTGFYLSIKCNPGTQLQYTGSGAAMTYNNGNPTGHVAGDFGQGCIFMGSSTLLAAGATNNATTTGINCGGALGCVGVNFHDFTLNGFGRDFSVASGTATTTNAYMISLNNVSLSGGDCGGGGMVGCLLYLGPAQNSGEAFSCTNCHLVDPGNSTTTNAIYISDNGVASAKFEAGSIDDAAVYVGISNNKVTFDGVHLENSAYNTYKGYAYIVASSSGATALNLTDNLFAQDSTNAAGKPPEFIEHAVNLTAKGNMFDNYGNQSPVTNAIDHSINPGQALEDVGDNSNQNGAFSNIVQLAGNPFPAMILESGNSYPFEITTNGGSLVSFTNGQVTSTLDSGGNWTFYNNANVGGALNVTSTLTAQVTSTFKGNISSTIQNAFLWANQNGIFVATTTPSSGGSGGVGTSTLGNYASGNIAFVLNSSTISAINGFSVNSSTGVFSAPSGTFAGNIAVHGAALSANSIESIANASVVGLRIQGTNTTDQAFATYVNGDNFIRFNFQPNGVLNWGAGTASADTDLYRSASGTLKTDTNLVAGQTLLVGGTSTFQNGITQTGGINSFSTSTFTGNVTTTALSDTGISSALVLAGSGNSFGAYGGSSNPCGANAAPTTISAVGALGGCTSAFLTSVSSTILFAGSYLSTTGNILNVSSTLASSSVSFTFGNATTTAPASWQKIKTTTLKNITSVDCSEYAPATTTIELGYTTSTAATSTVAITNVILYNIPCGIGGNTTTTFTTSTLPINSYLFAVVSSTAGTPTQTTVNISATKL